MSGIDLLHPDMQEAAALEPFQNVPLDIQAELLARSRELSHIEELEEQLGTSVPNIQGNRPIFKFVSNPSSVSVETFDRMKTTDDAVMASIAMRVNTMVSLFGDYHHPNADIQTFVRKALEQMEGSWNGNLTDMLTCEWAGFSITEKLWKYDPDFNGVPAYLPRALKTYHPLTIVFSTDANGNVEGVYQYQQYYGTAMNSSYFQMYGLMNGGKHTAHGFRPDMMAHRGDMPYPVYLGSDVSFMSINIPYEKCIHLTSNTSGNFNNPYGKSNLRGIYKHWVSKDALLKLKLIMMDRRAAPLLVVYVDPRSTVEEVSSEAMLDSAHAHKVMKTAEQAIAEALKNYHNSSNIIAPGRKGETYEIEAIQVQGDLASFAQAINDANTYIRQGLLIPDTVMGGGQGGSYAIGSEHTDTLGRFCEFQCRPHRQAILESFIRDILRFNFPKSMWEKDGLGEFIHQEQDVAKMNALSDIYSKLRADNFISDQNPDDFNRVRTAMDFAQSKPFTPQFGNSADSSLDMGAPDDLFQTEGDEKADKDEIKDDV